MAKDTNDKYIGTFRTEQQAVDKVCSVTGYTADDLIRLKYSSKHKLE